LRLEVAYLPLDTENLHGAFRAQLFP
jgi:hypothetical protein